MIMYAKTIIGIQLASKMTLTQKCMYKSWIDIFFSMSGDFFCKLFQKNFPLLSEMHVPVDASLPSMREKLLLTWEIVIHHSSVTEQTYVHKQAPSAVKSGTFNKLKTHLAVSNPEKSIWTKEPEASLPL